MSNDIKYRADTNGFEMGGPMSQTDTSYPNGVATQREYPAQDLGGSIYADGWQPTGLRG